MSDKIKNNKTKLSLSLAENAFCFLKESLRYVQEAESEENLERWKYAILFLAQATELSMKAQLERVHSSLVLVDPSKPISANSRTIGPDECLLRLKAWSPTDDMKVAEKLLVTAVSWRNQIIHFKFSLEIEQAKAVYSEIFLTLEKFWKFDLEYDAELVREVKNLSSLREHFACAAAQKLKGLNKDQIHDCFTCGNSSMVHDPKRDVCICYFCNTELEEILCEECGSLVAPSDLKRVYTGNYKRIDSWDRVCSDCAELHQSGGGDVDSYF